MTRAGSPSWNPWESHSRSSHCPWKKEEPNWLPGLPRISTNDKDETADLCLPPQRNLPARGFKPATLLAIGGGVMLYGWYHFGKGAREQR